MQEKEQCGLTGFVKQFNQRTFLDAISQLDGSVDLVWDSKRMMRQLNVIVTPKLLSEHTNVAKNFSLESPGISSADNLVFLLYPVARSVELLLTNWLEKLPDESNGSNHIFFIPEETYVLRERLKENPRIWSRISTVGSLPLHWFPSEQSGLVTMHLPQLPAQMLVNGDWNYLFKCAKALKHLVFQFNQSLTFHCKGEWSARIVDILRKLPESAGTQTFDAAKNEFKDVTDIVLIDRWLDPLTPMLRQFSFGGICDEFFGIDFRGLLKVPAEEFDEMEPGTVAESVNEHKEISLHDQVFERLQDLNSNSVAFKIRGIVDELKEEEQQRKSLASLVEYKNFVAKLPNLVVKRKSTGIFMRLAGIVQRRETERFYREILQCEQEIVRNSQPDKVFPFIEYSLIEAKDLNAILRLIILQCLLSPKGLKPSVLQSYTKQIVQSYGISELSRLLKLQLAGLIRDENFSDGRLEIRYPVLNIIQFFKKYKMNQSDLEEMRHSDFTSPNSSSSLLIRMIEEGLQTNWNDFAAFKMISGKEEPNQIMSPPPPKTSARTLIFVVGGITRAEMSMLNQFPSKLICCTTAFLNANDLLNTFHD